jgi:hypothetical protein
MFCEYANTTERYLPVALLRLPPLLLLNACASVLVGYQRVGLAAAIMVGGRTLTQSITQHHNFTTSTKDNLMVLDLCDGVTQHHTALRNVPLPHNTT